MAPESSGSLSHAYCPVEQTSVAAAGRKPRRRHRTTSRHRTQDSNRPPHQGSSSRHKGPEPGWGADTEQEVGQGPGLPVEEVAAGFHVFRNQYRALQYPRQCRPDMGRVVDSYCTPFELNLVHRWLLHNSMRFLVLPSTKSYQAYQSALFLPRTCDHGQWETIHDSRKILVPF